MDTGKLYFVKDEFYERFKGCGLLENKEIIDGKQHNRPCCYLFKYNQNDSDIYWLIPISSKIQKYTSEYRKSIEKYGKCDNISFGYVLGEKRAFLPQNLFPITKAKYVSLSGDFSTPPTNRTTIDGTDIRVTNNDNVNEAIQKLTKQNSTSVIDVLQNDPENPIDGQIWITP